MPFSIFAFLILVLIPYPAYQRGVGPLTRGTLDKDRRVNWQLGEKNPCLSGRSEGDGVRIIA